MNAIVGAIDQGICPLCGRPNHCVVAAGGMIGDPCWCWGVRAAPEALARIPAALRQKVCLCRECLTRRDWKDMADLPHGSVFEEQD
ncbi:cysteine-rich CWC family protein [Fontisphaera persica]|uniref:cysteine-rich CWC family protein n=1 Tax=Fontisphaera persica TaxID=2974023 RepID=UPI0024C01AAE|nr:cysteine-rich CWC family protein [Fontisphaera persica]WCJ59095.1 cysteine-rich CWC family protein [Fontisphaera persica]